METLPTATPHNLENIPDLPTRVAVLEAELARLQVIPKEPEKPWYRSLSSVLAIAAFAVSFGTTAVSYYRTYTQDIQASHQELRTVLQRLNALPRENFDAMQKYKDDPTSVGQIGSLYNGENALLAKQAEDIARHLPQSDVSATEFNAIAYALSNALDPKGAREFYKLAQSRVQQFNDAIAIQRSLASLDIAQGNTSNGRAEFQEALDIFKSYPEYDPYTQAQTNALTELQWANAEGGVGALKEASAHVADAKNFVRKLPFSGNKESLEAQIVQMNKRIAQGTASQNPTGTSAASSNSLPASTLPLQLAPPQHSSVFQMK